MNKQQFYTKINLLIEKQIYQLEELGCAKDNKLFASYFGTKENVTSIATQIINLYIKLIEFEQKYLQDNSINDELTIIDWNIVSDFIKRNNERK